MCSGFGGLGCKVLGCEVYGTYLRGCEQKWGHMATVEWSYAVKTSENHLLTSKVYRLYRVMLRCNQDSKTQEPDFQGNCR